MSNPMRLAMGGGGSRPSAIARRKAAPDMESPACPSGAGSCQVTVRVLSVTSIDLQPIDALDVKELRTFAKYFAGGVPMNGARVLITGATGVVGRLAIPRLLARGHRVTAVGRTSEKRAELSALGADAIELDL